VIVLRLGPDDLARCRFAISPLLETTGAVRMLAAPARRDRWPPGLGELPVRSVPGRAVAVLSAMMPARGYMPDFLTPPPARPQASIDEELARVTATPAELAVEEIRRSLRRRPAPQPLRELLADPATLAERVAELLAEVWRRLVLPYWPRLRDLTDGDISYRSRRLADGGLGPLLANLHPHVGWDGSELRVAKPVELRRELRGEGLVLVPTGFGWPAVQVMLNPPWQPTLIYPARGVGALWERSRGRGGGALGRLLGQTRTLLLESLGEPATTTDLAARHGRAPATVSHHLTLLHDVGLLVARRDGRWVRYERSPLGDRLLQAGGSAAAGEASRC
jgi:DNA-binding transcriptional ArsR family regulator